MENYNKEDMAEFKDAQRLAREIGELLENNLNDCPIDIKASKGFYALQLVLSCSVKSLEKHIHDEKHGLSNIVLRNLEQMLYASNGDQSGDFNFDMI